MDAVTEIHGGDILMIDSAIVRVHRNAAGAKKGVEIVARIAAQVGSRPRRASRSWAIAVDFDGRCVEVA
jgi:hypothetical protein